MPKVINHDMQTGYDVRFIWRFEVPLVQQTLAGPLGALVGAAYGARSRGTTLYAIETKDGHNVIVETAKSKEIAKLDGLACHT